MRQLGNEVIIATRNAGKVKEFEALFGAAGIQVRSLADYPQIPDIIEDGADFAANSLIKAKAVARALQLPAVADDSGLCVDKLGGEPGVYSARYAGEGAGDAANNRKLLSELSRLKLSEESAEADNPHLLSKAQFICAITFVDQEGEMIAQTEGKCEGWIIAEPRGNHGFGYDPLFYLPEFGKTMAELTPEEKNTISHRGRAMQQLWSVLGSASR